MIDYTITGITSTNDFNVYTGLTPIQVTYIATYSGGTTQFTIFNLPYNFKFYVVVENKKNGYRTSKLIKTPSAYCATGVCDGLFSINQTPVPTPTISVTPSVTPSISITPTFTPTVSVSTTLLLHISPTPTKTPTLTPTLTPTITPTITPSPSPVITCGFYRIDCNVGTTDHVYIDVTYLDCSGIFQVVRVFNASSVEVCVKETAGNPEFRYSNSSIIITRIGNC